MSIIYYYTFSFYQANFVCCPDYAVRYEIGSMCKHKFDDEASCVAKKNCNVEIPSNVVSGVMFQESFKTIKTVLENEKQGIFEAAENCPDSVTRT